MNILNKLKSNNENVDNSIFSENTNLKVEDFEAIDNKETITPQRIFSVCEYSTFKCIYNVVASTNRPKSLLPFLPKRFDPTYTNDNLWIRYKAIVEIGFDVSEIEVGIGKDDNHFDENEIRIKLPKAKIINKPEIDSSSIKDGDYEYVFSTKEGIIENDIHIDLKDQRDTISFANANLIDELNQNEEIFLLAEDRMKKLIKAYVDSINIMFNKKYYIKWL